MHQLDEIILKDFKDNFISIKDLSNKYKMNKDQIKDFLKSKLGLEYNQQIKRIAGHYGSRVFLNHLKNKEFRERYSKKMSDVVSKSIKSKMRNKNYKKKWLEKVRIASKLGHEKIRNLLENDPKFRTLWIKNCLIGGESTYRQNKGAFDPKNKKKRLLGALRGLQNTTRKVIGPNGEHMYNLHEVRVAKAILNFTKNYIYEKRFYVNNQNGFISCDFIVPFKKSLIIEATTWDDVLEKCSRFRKKYNYLISLLGNNFEFIIVVNTQTLKEKYSKYLPNLKIFTIKELNEYLKNIAGVGFEFVEPLK